MTPEEQALIKEALHFLKAIRKTDHVLYPVLLKDKALEERYLFPLMRLVSWSSADEAAVEARANQWQEETSGKNFRERGEKIKKLLLWGSATGLAVASAYLLKKPSGQK